MLSGSISKLNSIDHGDASVHKLLGNSGTWLSVATYTAQRGHTEVLLVTYSDLPTTKKEPP